jgi:Glycosyl hydrolase family 20, catalytic domain
MQKFELKLAQLDLARQMETPEFICDFIRLISKCGYNGLILYLEDRIRTASYSLAAEGEYYSIEDMTALVAFGREHGIELIPCVSTLGHAERFLRHAELSELAELTEEMTGRFGGKEKTAFCISHPLFYNFIENYLTEVAAVFESGYFHAGLDEFWDYNLCPRCRKQMPDKSAEHKLFLEHIFKIREILLRSSKRMMMWSDMFEFYPDIFGEIPRDVIMVDWQYQNDVRDYRAHLLDQAVENRLTVNAAYGFECIIAAADRSLSNAPSYIEYAEDHQVKGFLFTYWEKTDSFIYRSLPMLVYAGFRANGKNDCDAFELMMHQLFGNDTAELAVGIRLMLSIGVPRHFEEFSEEHMFVRDAFGLPYREVESDKATFAVIQAHADKVTVPTGKRCIEDMLNILEEKLIAHQIKKTVHSIFDKGFSSRRGKELFSGVVILDNLFDRFEHAWQKWRPEIKPMVFPRIRTKLIPNLKALPERLAKGSFVKISFCLPDGFGLEKCTVLLRFASCWRKAGEGVFKADRPDTALFTRFLVFEHSDEEKLEAVRLECSGFGGIGISFVEVCIKEKHYYPSAVVEQCGKVENPVYILDNDVKFAWFGGQSTREDYFDANASACIHATTLELQPGP